MTYSLNPLDPFAEDEGAVLVVPQDRPDPITGTLAMFVQGMPRPGIPVASMTRRCSHCSRAMVIPQQALPALRLFVTCPLRHEAETIDWPEGFILKGTQP